MRPRPGGTDPEAAVLWTVDKCVVNLSNWELNQHEEETMLRVSFDVNHYSQMSRLVMPIIKQRLEQDTKLDTRAALSILKLAS